MDTEKLHIGIMVKDDWGNKLSENESFYRLLFKFDKKKDSEDKLTNDEVNWLFASYKKWFNKTQDMLNDCYEATTGNREAQVFGEQLKFDILEHVHQIITECKLENDDLINDLTVQADIEKRRIAREEQEKAERDNMEP